MKQINVRLEEEFIKEVKISAINHGISVQELVKRALESYINNKQETQQASKQPIQTIEQPIKVESEQASITETKQEEDDSNYYIIRKTHKVGRPEKGMRQLQKGPLTWMLFEGYRAHYDENEDLIPFRFTGEDGKVYDADAEEIKEIEEAFGKPVKIES